MSGFCEEVPLDAEEDSCVALPEKDVSSCDEDNSTRSNSTTIMTAPPFAGGKEVVHGILIY